MNNFFILIPLSLLIVGQILAKMAAKNISLEHFSLLQFFSFLPLTAFFLLFLRGIVWILILKKLKLSFAYPIMSLSYIFILLLSWYLFGETISVSEIAASFLIVMGCLFIAKADSISYISSK